MHKEVIGNRVAFIYPNNKPYLWTVGLVFCHDLYSLSILSKFNMRLKCLPTCSHVARELIFCWTKNTRWVLWTPCSIDIKVQSASDQRWPKLWYRFAVWTTYSDLSSTIGYNNLMPKTHVLISRYQIFNAALNHGHMWY